MSAVLTWKKQWRWNQKDASGRPLTWNGLAPENKIMATSTDTPVVVNITPTQKAAILAKVGELAVLLPWAVGMSDQERHDILKLGIKKVGWDEKASGHMANHPEFIPAYVDMPALAQNRLARADVGDITRAVQAVLESLTSTGMKLGQQILKPELAYYSSTQQAAKHGVPGAQAIADDLGGQFVHSNAKPAPAPAAK